MAAKIKDFANQTYSATDDDENDASKKDDTAAATATDDYDNDESKKENDEDNDDSVDDVLPSVSKGGKHWILHWKQGIKYGNNC